MKYLVDADVLSEPTRPQPSPAVVTWLRRHERALAVDPVILGEIRYGFIAATALAHRMTVVTRNVTDFEKAGCPVIDPFA